MKMRSDTVERLKPQALRWSPTRTDEVSQFRDVLRAWACEHGPGWLHIPSQTVNAALAALTRGPFRYRQYADRYLDVAMRYAHAPVKQAVISPSALSLMYPAQGIRDYSREQFIDDLLREHETEIRRCLKKGAHKVQVDFTEGRLAVK